MTFDEEDKILKKIAINDVDLAEFIGENIKGEIKMNCSCIEYIECGECVHIRGNARLEKMETLKELIRLNNINNCFDLEPELDKLEYLKSEVEDFLLKFDEMIELAEEIKELE